MQVNRDEWAVDFKGNKALQNRGDTGLISG